MKHLKPRKSMNDFLRLTGKSQVTLGEELFLSYKTVSKLLKGEKVFLSTALNVCRILQINPKDYFYTDDSIFLIKPRKAFKDLLNDMGIQYKQLGALVGIDEHHAAYTMTNGNCHFNQEEVTKICEYFKIDMDEYFEMEIF